jgi:hypothetical protein
MPFTRAGEVEGELAPRYQHMRRGLKPIPSHLVVPVSDIFERLRVQASLPCVYKSSSPDSGARHADDVTIGQNSLSTKPRRHELVEYINR